MGAVPCERHRCFLGVTGISKRYNTEDTKKIYCLYFAD